MYTLLKHHQQKLENLEIGAVFSSIGAIVGAYPLGIDLCSSWINQSPMLLSQPIITACITLSAVSLLSFSQCIIPSEKREYIIKKLEQAFETGQITPADIHDIENKTQEDIFTNIHKLTIIPSKHISRIEKKGEVLPQTWDINDNKTLKDTLNGNYNSSNYTLYLQDKE